MRKGTYHHTEEQKAKIRAARQRRKEELGYINSPETRKKIGEAGVGRQASEETRAKIRAAGKQRIYSPEHLQKLQEAGHVALREKTGALSASWKGDAVGYIALQQWVAQQKGKPQGCEICGINEPRRYNWTSRSGERLRDVHDWMSACVPCIRKRSKLVPWNKDKKTGPNLKGRKPRKPFLTSTSFQKGQTPHNKGKKMLSYSGANHPHWKGGTTSLAHKIRTSLEYKEWREAIVTRDNRTCVLCGYVSSKPRDIRADHMQPFHQYPDLRFELSNGRTLCVPCDLRAGWQIWREGKET